MSLSSIAKDFVYALKAMRRAPGFTVAAVSTIALGVGANTAVFSLLHALLLQPLDAARPEELVRVYTSEGHTLRDVRDRFGASSYAAYTDLQRSPALTGLLAYMPVTTSVRLHDATFRVEGRVVSENFFAVLGRPVLRGGWQSEAHAVTSPSVIVSHGFWTTRLGADPSAVGRALDVNGQSVRIAGVTSPDFHGIELSDVALYFPFGAAPVITGRRELLTERGERPVKLVGRLAPGASPESAERALDGIMKTLGAEFPASNAQRLISVRRARSIVPMELTGRAVIPVAGLVFGATLVMLAIAGVNVAAVLLARTIRRRRELAVRLSLGATPFRLVRQLMTESITRAFAAGVVVVALVALLPVFAMALGAPASLQPTIDPSVLGYAIAVTVGFGAMFGIAPAVAGMRSDVVESLRAGEATGRPARARAQRALVCAQIALSVLLVLVSGGLLGSPGHAPVDAVPRLARAAADRIAHSALNGRGVRTLATELGVGERQLRRAVRRALGAAPHDLAQTTRLRRARQLLTETAIPVISVAFLSGFQSLRRFNAAFRERYRISPRELRRATRTALTATT